MAETKFESYVAGFMGLIGSEGTDWTCSSIEEVHRRLTGNTNEVSLRENISVVATSIVVNRSLRRKGLGTILLDHMHTCCRCLGFGRVVLWTWMQLNFM